MEAGQQEQETKRSDYQLPTWNTEENWKGRGYKLSKTNTPHPVMHFQKQASTSPSSAPTRDQVFKHMSLWGTFPSTKAACARMGAADSESSLEAYGGQGLSAELVGFGCHFTGYLKRKGELVHSFCFLLALIYPHTWRSRCFG